MGSKKWYASKTLWVNGLAVVAAVVQGVTGAEWFRPEYQVLALGIINAVLRAVTSEEISW